ncbi:MAG: glycosyltransferase, partial [Planctomycetota bacterium]
VYPRRFEALCRANRLEFPRQVPVEAVDDLEAFLTETEDLVHLQFPFLPAERLRGLESVLEIAAPIPRGSLFTVHAGVNVPVVDGLHYIFHTEGLARRLEVPCWSVVPSLIEPPPSDQPPPPTVGRTVLWVSRNDDAKFSEGVLEVLETMLARDEEVRFQFVGAPPRFRLPTHPRITVEDCPSADLEARWRAATVFWYYPHERLEETWCRTVTEAMARGVPSVVAAWGAMGEQLAGEAGGLFEDPRSCVDALTRALDDEDLRRRQGLAGRTRAAGYRDDALRAWRELYAPLAHVSGLTP